MISLLLRKELLNAVYQPRWIAGILLFTVLLSISLISGSLIYQDEFDRFQVASQMSEQNLREQRGWETASKTEFVPPNPLAIFSGGVNFDIGQSTTLSKGSTVQLQRSYYNKNLLFALFRIVDFGTIITLIGSLLAILFAYDTISGEREQGTLKLVAAYHIPRFKLFVAKILSGTILLIIPIVIAFLIQFLTQQLLGIRFDASTWQKIGLIFGSTVLFMAFFVSLSVMVSAYTRESSASFLSLLVIWVTFTLIVPRLGILAASYMIETPSIAEVESRKSLFEKDQWAAHSEQMSLVWSKRTKKMQEIEQDIREVEVPKLQKKWNMEDEQKRLELQERISDYSLREDEMMSNIQRQQEQLGLQLSQISPSSMYSLLLMDISETSLSAKDRLTDQLRSYRNDFLAFTNKKNEESGGQRSGFFSINFSTDTGVSVQSNKERESGLDISEMPRFEYRKATLAGILQNSISRLGMLAIFWMVSVLLGMLRFMKYDVR